MEKSKSTDKLKLLTDLAQVVAKNVESCDSIKLTWKVLDDEIVVPEVEITGLKMKS
jgi:hypothetical protein